MVGAAQQVEQGFLVVLAGRLQCVAPLHQFLLELGRDKALGQHGVAGQLVDYAGVLQQVASGPSRRAQQAQQPLVHGRALQQQREVALAAQQRLHPVGDAHRRIFTDTAFTQPLPGALHQPY